jgi:hypothetical protein
MKLGRNYRLTIVNPQGDQIDITPPFTLHFTVERNNLATANTGEIEITNLGPNTRGRVFKDRFDTSLEWRLVLYAGYGTNLFLVVSGNIHEAYSYKEGPNWTTKISVFDGAQAFQNGFVSASYSAGTDKSQVIKDAIFTLEGIQEGYLGAYAKGEGPRAAVVFGPTREVLMDLTEGHFFVDNGILHVSGDFEYDGSETLVLDETQLLATPQRRDTSLEVSILFYPQARVNVLASLSSLFPIYNGTYKICSIHHDVLISESENGKAETSLGLLLLGKQFKAINS